MSSKIIIAIDGPAASGKSTLSRTLARELGILYVDTGAMYRAFTWRALQDGVNLSEPEAIQAWLSGVTMETRPKEGAVVLFINGVEIEDAWLRSDEVNAHVSKIAAVPAIRDIAVAAQRQIGDEQSAVFEGRDMGTVVFPGTPYKFYIDVSPDVRAARRAAQGQNDAIAERDRQDSSRATAPLKMAGDAVVIDNSGPIAPTVTRMLEMIRTGK
ncbi:MAG: (d)CMP kinase [Verrucomicrobiae bacterium]|nr:(d)CMP kinase [Verrucomicrobiae bacterium]